MHVHFMVNALGRTWNASNAYVIRTSSARQVFAVLPACGEDSSRGRRKGEGAHCPSGGDGRLTHCRRLAVSWASRHRLKARSGCQVVWAVPRDGKVHGSPSRFPCGCMLKTSTCDSDSVTVFVPRELHASSTLFHPARIVSPASQDCGVGEPLMEGVTRSQHTKLAS